MTQRLMSSVSIAFVLLVVSAPAASAQVKGDFSIGYSFLNLVDADKLPLGWNFSIANGNDFVSGIGDFAGHYLFEGGNAASLYTFTGGVRVHGRRTATIVPFAQATFGGGAVVEGGAYFFWVFQPGGGVDVSLRPGGPRLRGQVDLPVYFNGEGGVTSARVSVGIVIPMK